MFTGVQNGHPEPQKQAAKRGRPLGRKKKMPKRQLKGSLDDPLHRGRVLQLIHDRPDWSARELAAATGACHATVLKYREELKSNPLTAGVRELSDSSAESTPSKIRRENIQELEKHLKKTKENTDISTVALGEKFGVHRTTVARWLRELQWRFVQDKVTPNTSAPEWRQRRLDFAARFLNHRPDDFVFCDEKIFRATAHQKGRWRYIGKRPKGFNHNGPKRVIRDRWTCTMHVFGMLGIGWSRMWLLPKKGSGGRGGVTAEDFQRTLERDKREIVSRLRGKTLVLDGASIHTCASTKEFWRRWGVQVLEGWPPHSPDLNPIENLWAVLVARLGDLLVAFGPNKAENRIAMWNVFKGVHSRVEPELKTRLVRSFEGRLGDVLLLDGDLVQ